MELKKYLEEKANYAMSNRILRLFVIVVGLAVVVNSVFTYYYVRDSKVILVPPNITTQAFVSGSDASDEYLKAMARYICQLTLNYNPGNVRAQLSDALKLMSADAYVRYKQAFYDLADKAETGNVSSAFFINKITINRKEKTMIVQGLLNQWTQDKQFITNEGKQYLIRYAISDGMFQLKEIKEYKEGGSQQ